MNIEQLGYLGFNSTDPAAFAGYYQWQVYFRTTSGDVLLT